MKARQAAAKLKSTACVTQRRTCCLQVFEGRVVEGDPNASGHVICTTAGTGPDRQTINYSTERVVGSGSFGVVFQATCLETGETVRTCPVLAFHCCCADEPPRAASGTRCGPLVLWACAQALCWILHCDCADEPPRALLGLWEHIVGRCEQALCWLLLLCR